MRDTFVLLWVGFLLIGVIGSIVSGIRKQGQQAQTSQNPRRVRTQRIVLSPSPSPRTGSVAGGGVQWPAPPGQVPDWVQRIVSQVAPPSPPAPAVRPAPAPTRPAAAPPAPMVEHPLEFPMSHRRRRPIFGSREAIVQAVIAAEVLGKPRALRDEYFQA